LQARETSLFAKMKRDIKEQEKASLAVTKTTIAKPYAKL
jgi:hypothetical protein